MTNAKLYLDVPFAQKDQAKALGARWDAARKKWYAPPGVDSAPFAQWKSEASGSDAKQSAGRAPQSVASGITNITHPLDKNFVPYCGEDPPWE
jgi:hypothetical protein